MAYVAKWEAETNSYGDDDCRDDRQRDSFGAGVNCGVDFGLASAENVCSSSVLDLLTTPPVPAPAPPVNQGITLDLHPEHVASPVSSVCSFAQLYQPALLVTKLESRLTNAAHPASLCVVLRSSTS
ncbi:hypothetical protein GALMADRAFT_146648 [Galerina marginata CBS 339.88]|uniref:Uncharacterized protein n=1 Tax=Galerina marginata (strain CBS 339.88) TaxID=685588 RepID=A0A067SB60_GALM3|nr:hypothetical protein GALMADRAFT_146648 [Galerina marginata CBS 339.88]